MLALSDCWLQNQLPMGLLTIPRKQTCWGLFVFNEGQEVAEKLRGNRLENNLGIIPIS